MSYNPGQSSGDYHGQPYQNQFPGTYDQNPPPGQYPHGHLPPMQSQPYPPLQGGYPPPHQVYPPQQQNFGAPPPNQYSGYPPQQPHFAPPTPASPGYNPSLIIQGTMQSEIAAVRGAMNDKSGKKLMKVLSDLNPVQMASLCRKYEGQIFSTLSNDVKTLTAGEAENSLLFLIRGPLEHDVHYIHEGINSSNLKLLNDVLLCRSNADIRAIKEAYRQRHGANLEGTIQNSSLEEKYRRLYCMVLSAERTEDSVPPNPKQISEDTKGLQEATEGVIFGSNEMAVFRILASRNDSQLREIAAAFQRDYHKSLEAVLEKEYSGKMENTVLQILDRAKNRAKSDAKLE